MTPVFDHAEENVPQLRLPFGLTMPFGKNRRRDLDVAAKLFGRVAAQKEPVKKGRLPLRELEVLGDFNRNELCHRGHKGKCSLPKSVSTSSSTADLMARAGQCPFGTGYAPVTCTTQGLSQDSNRRRMQIDMTRLYRARRGSLARRFLRFGLRRGLRSVEVNPDDFRRQLANKHGLWVPNFSRMHDVPLERLDEIAKSLIRDAARLAMAEGAGFGLGGMMTLIPDAGLLTAITMRLIQRLCLLYGFESQGQDERMELWMAAAAASGVDYGKDLAEKQMFEKLAPRIVERLAIRIGRETAEKWVARLIPLASSAIGGALNFSFVRAWGRRVQRNLRTKHLLARASGAAPPHSASQAAFV